MNADLNSGGGSHSLERIEDLRICEERKGRPVTASRTHTTARGVKSLFERISRDEGAVELGCKSCCSDIIASSNRSEYNRDLLSEQSITRCCGGIVESSNGLVSSHHQQLHLGLSEHGRERCQMHEFCWSCK